MSGSMFNAPSDLDHYDEGEHEETTDCTACDAEDVLVSKLFECPQCGRDICHECTRTITDNCQGCGLVLCDTCLDAGHDIDECEDEQRQNWEDEQADRGEQAARDRGLI